MEFEKLNAEQLEKCEISEIKNNALVKEEVLKEVKFKKIDNHDFAC